MKKKVLKKDSSKTSKNDVVVLWKRVFAYVIDLFILSLILYFPMRNLYKDMPDGDIEAAFAYIQSSQELSLSFFIANMMIALITILYWALLEFKLGQSVGKMAMKIKVVDFYGKNLGFVQCFLRNLTKASTFILFLDFIYGVIKKDYRRYFEVLSKTKVVNVNGC